MHATADRKKFAVEFLESEGHAAEESLAPVLEIKIAHFCGETIDEIQQLLCDLGEFLTVEAVDQKGDFARCLSAAYDDVPLDDGVQMASCKVHKAHWD